MDLVCNGYLDCVLGNIFIYFIFGGWAVAVLAGIFINRALNKNATFSRYSKTKRIIMTTVIVVLLAFVLVSILYLFFGKGSSSTNLGF